MAATGCYCAIDVVSAVLSPIAATAKCTDPSGRSDMANLSRAKDAALGAVIRDLAWDTANSPRKAQQIRSVFSAPSLPMRPIGPPATTLATACL
jgi:hypothetical protein